MAVRGKLPELAVVVQVEAAFMHCAKCLIRSQLWEPDHWPDVSELSPLARVLIDHADLTCTIDEFQEIINDSYNAPNCIDWKTTKPTVETADHSLSMWSLLSLWENRFLQDHPLIHTQRVAGAGSFLEPFYVADGRLAKEPFVLSVKMRGVAVANPIGGAGGIQLFIHEQAARLLKS